MNTVVRWYSCNALYMKWNLLGGAALYGLPLSIILKGLSILAAPTVCDDVVHMKGFDQLGV
jgi:hypothetical protein